MKTLDELVNSVYHYFFEKKGDPISKETTSPRENADKLELDKLLNKLQKEDIVNEIDHYAVFKKANENRKLQALTNIKSKIHPAKKEIKFFQRWKYMAAASILLLAGVATYHFHKPFVSDADIYASVTSSSSILPGHSRAQLTMPDGSTVVLDSLHESISMGDAIRYDDGSILSQKDFAAEQKLFTLQTPRGGEYVLTLSDGTRVHLNANSKLIYPLEFSDNNREVTLEGEAYFDVAHNARKPFIVHTDNKRIKVLGTSFNVRNYPNEASSMVTLVKGKVQLLDGQNNPELTPGMQSISKDGVTQVKMVNVEDFISWKDGLFVFNNDNLKQVASKISNWYDVEFDIKPSAANVRIWGSVDRYDTFDKVLEVLQLVDTDLKVKIEGRRVRVMK